VCARCSKRNTWGSNESIFQASQGLAGGTALSSQGSCGALSGGIIAIITLVGRTYQEFTEGKKLLLFGNGGSAADAQHLAAEFVNRYVIDRPPLPAIALTTDTSILTSVSNDLAFNEIFAKQLRALGKEGDVAVGISTSGSSPNIIKAF
jgi:D-sedoheptulose 7-phosphate isomerase